MSDEKPADRSFFFINKFNITCESPMATVSIMSTHAIAQHGFSTTLILEGNPDTNANQLLQTRFGLKLLPHFTIKLLPRRLWNIKMTQLFYLRACLHIIILKIKTAQKRYYPAIPHFFHGSLFLKLCGCRVFFETHSYHGKHNLSGIPTKS